MQSFETGRVWTFSKGSEQAMWFDECLLKNVNLACCVQNRPGGYKCSGHMDEQSFSPCWARSDDEGLGWHMIVGVGREENRYLDLRSLVQGEVMAWG